MNRSPNSNTADLYGSDKSISSFGVAGGNSPPAFENKETVFHQMAQSVEIFIVIPLFLAVSLWRNYSFHARRCRIGQNIICVIASISQQRFRGDPLNQMDSFFTISSGTFCNKDSDWHTMRIHGQMYFGVEPPFVRDIS